MCCRSEHDIYPLQMGRSCFQFLLPCSKQFLLIKQEPKSLCPHPLFYLIFRKRVKTKSNLKRRPKPYISPKRGSICLQHENSSGQIETVSQLHRAVFTLLCDNFLHKQKHAMHSTTNVYMLLDWLCPYSTLAEKWTSITSPCQNTKLD